VHVKWDIVLYRGRTLREGRKKESPVKSFTFYIDGIREEFSAEQKVFKGGSLARQRKGACMQSISRMGKRTETGRVSTALIL